MSAALRVHPAERSNTVTETGPSAMGSAGQPGAAKMEALAIDEQGMGATAPGFAGTRAPEAAR